MKPSTPTLALAAAVVAAVACGSTLLAQDQPATRPAGATETPAMQTPTTPPATPPAATNAPPATGPAAAASDRRTTESGLTIIEVKLPDAAVTARPGDQVWVHYTGKLQDGSVFDSSLQRGQPISFPLGAGRVIKGWDEGIAGMRVGEKRQLVIPPALAYGPTARPGIPANSTLVFDVQLVGVYNAEADAAGK